MKVFGTLVIIILTFGIISAQSSDINFENISTFSGLSASRAKCIIQDSDGYLWIGTMGGGLNRYDGYSFTVYKHREEDSTSLGNNNIYSLAEDKNGDMWIATSDGVSIYIKGEDRFINYFFRENFKELSDIGYHSVYEVFVDSKDRIWIGTSYHGALLFNKDENIFVPIPQQSSDSIDALPQVYGDITEDKNGKIWASGGASGLFWYDEDKSLFLPATMDSKNWDLLKSQEIFRVCADSKNNIWVMTATDLYKYLTSSQKLKHLLNYKVINPINGGYEGELVEDDQGNMFAVHINLPHPVQFPNLSDESVTLNSNKMYPTDIFIDSFGIIWVSDWTQGLHKYVPSKQAFYQIKDKDVGKNLWGSSRIDIICQSLHDPDLIFIHSSEFGRSVMSSYNLGNGRVKNYNIESRSFNTMVSNSDGSFWVGLWNEEGIMKWNPDTDELKPYFADSSKTPNLANMSIASLQKDDKGSLWIGALNGLYRMSPDEKELELIIPEHAITAIYFDEDILWLGTHSAGFIKYNLNSEQIENFQYDKYSNSLSNNIVWDIYRDKEGFLWLATEGGLNRFDLRTNDFEVYKESDGLGNDYIAAILPDDNGSLWLSTNSGITHMHRDSKNRISFSNYDAMDGLNNPEFLFPIKLKDNLGRMFFGGSNGLYYFIPQERKSKPPLIHITDFMINGKSLFTSNPSSSKKLSQGDLDLELSHDQNTLAFEFIALHFAKPNKNRYSYYLEGYEPDWLYTNNREVQYVNLEPGSYNFRLRAANRDGIWSTEEIILPINIAYPWWNTWYAYLIYFGLVIGGLTGVRRIELNRRKDNENKKLLEAENRRKSVELEEARQLQLSMLPREIPQIPQLDVAVYMKTATEVGGDYYDFHVGLDGTLTAVIGDATGHGMRAGTMVTSTKSLFSSYAESDDIINTFHEMTRCIKNMHLDNLSMCMTMIKIEKDQIRMSSAGMPPVYIYRKNTSSVEEYLFQGMPLGTMSNFPYEVRETSLSKGDTILMMSDGFAELVNEKNEMLGYQRAKHIFEEVATESPENIVSKLKDAGSGWMNGKDPDDDVTFVVIKVK